MSKRGGAALGAVVAIAALSVACGGGSETRVVDQYFNALKAERQRDPHQLRRGCLRQEGGHLEDQGGRPRRRAARPLSPSSPRRSTDLEAELAANKKAAGAYSLENYADIDKVKELQKAGKPVPGNLKDVADKWAQFNDKDRELKRAVAEAKSAMEREKRNVALSVGQQDDVEKLTGEVVSKQVDVDLTIAGAVQPYVMTLRKYELTGGSGPRQVSRWVIQNIAPKG